MKQAPIAVALHFRTDQSEHPYSAYGKRPKSLVTASVDIVPSGTKYQWNGNFVSQLLARLSASNTQAKILDFCLISYFDL